MSLKSVTIIAIAILMSVAYALGRGSDEAKSNYDKGELHTVVGCLSKTDGTYVITGGGPGPKQFRIIGGDTRALKGKEGQTVRVFGLVGTSGPLENVAPPYSAGSTTGVGYNTIVAQKIKVVGGLCSNPGEEYLGDHE